MRAENKTKVFIIKNTVALFTFATILSCSTCYANPDFTCFQSNTQQSIKLVNPLYLDKTKTTKPTIKAPKQYKGEFSESDYFSSQIDDLPPLEEFKKETKDSKQIKEEKILEPTTDIKNIPQNSETKLPTFTEMQNNSEDFIKPVNRFFEPPTNKSIEEQNENDIIRSNSFNVIEDSKNVTTQENSIQNNENDIDIEGKIISDIQFVGLKTLKPRDLEKFIKTQVGSFFNEAILQQDLQNIYSIGFFTENIAIEPEINTNGNITIKFILEENIPVTDVSIIGNTVISTMELLPFVTPLKNLPQNIEHINNSIDKINDYYHSKGYILANVDSVDDSDDGNLAFSIQEGIINKITIEGNEKTKDYVIERNIMTQPNTVYNENYLKDDLSRIYSSKIFKEVNREIAPSKNNDGTYNVKVVVKEDSPNNLSLGGGIDNGLGAFGSVCFSENNFLGRGQRLSLSGILGSGILLSDASIKERMNYQIELNFFEPYFLNADNSLASKLYYRDLGSWQVPLAIERRIGFNTTVEHKVHKYNNLTTSFSSGVEHIHLKEGDFNKIAELYTLRNLNIAERDKQLTGGFYANFAPGIKYSTLDSEEIPRNGILASAKFMESVGIDDFNNTNGRIAGSVTKYFPVREKSSFSLTARGGVKVHGDDMPEVMAFRLGGPYSLRGFRMSGVGTGDGFLMGSAELATPLPLVDRLKWDFLQRIRLTFFVDAGKVFDPTVSSVLFDRPLSAVTAGIGLRMYVPGVGPISVDYGIPLTNPGDYGSKNGYFTFGTSGINTYGW